MDGTVEAVVEAADVGVATMTRINASGVVGARWSCGAIGDIKDIGCWEVATGDPTPAALVAAPPPGAPCWEGDVGVDGDWGSGSGGGMATAVVPPAESSRFASSDGAPAGGGDALPVGKAGGAASAAASVGKENRSSSQPQM